MASDRIEQFGLRMFGRVPTGLKTQLVRVVKPSFTVGGMPIVTRSDGCVLIVRHSYEPMWTFPGGLINKREPVEVAMGREIFEEVGLRIELVGEPSVDVDPFRQVVRVLWRARPRVETDTERVVPRSAEIAELRWSRPEALPELPAPVRRAYDGLLRAERWRAPR